MLDILKQAKEKRSKKLNKIELIKSKMTPKEAFKRLTEISKKGYEALSLEDKNVFLKYFGLFDKNEFTPQKFMLRVRIPGGRLSPKQAKVLGEVARDFGEDYIDLTTRMQVELRFIKIEDVPQIFEKLEGVGITAYQTGIDNLRNIVTDPLDGIGADNFIESFPILLNLQSLFLKKEEWIGTLPRKFNTAITGSVTNRSNAYGHDCCFVLAQKDGVYGFNVYLGGKVGKVAKSADIFLKPDEVEEFFENLINLFKEYGFRDNRNKNRLYFLIEAVGMDNFRKALEEFSGKSFKRAGETLCKMEHFDNNQGKVQLKDGSFALHAIVPGGIFKGSDLIEAADIALENEGEIRLSIEQNLYITNVKNPLKVLKKPFFLKYKNVNTPFFNNLVACAGKRECSFGVILNKPDAIEMADFLSKEVDLKDAKVRMYWSACVKGCGIHEWGDIGFVGAKARVDGKTEFGVDILMGGSLSKAKEAHTILKAVPLRFAKFLIKEIMIEFKENREYKENFEDFYYRYLNRFSKGAVGFLMIFNYFLEKNGIDYRFSLSNQNGYGKMEFFEIFSFGLSIYKKLTGEDAYLEVVNFTPLGNKKPAFLHKINPSISKELSDIVYKMIHPDIKQRYQVFSEIIKDMGF